MDNLSKTVGALPESAYPWIFAILAVLVLLVVVVLMLLKNFSFGPFKFNSNNGQTDIGDILKLILELEEKRDKRLDAHEQDDKARFDKMEKLTDRCLDTNTQLVDEIKKLNESTTTSFKDWSEKHGKLYEKMVTVLSQGKL